MKQHRLLFFILTAYFITPKLYSQSNQQIDSVIIKKGSHWSYYDKGNIEDMYWIEKQLLPNTWKKGKAPLGYNMKDITTTISFGNDSLNKNLTSYFHKTIYIDNVDKFYAYQLNLRRDDGAIIYINGREVWRTNMPAQDSITSNTKSVKIVQKKEERQFFDKIIFPNAFLEGINIIAVELHQRGKTTTDAVFDLELLGTNNLLFLNEFFTYQNNQNSQLKQYVKELQYKIELEKRQTELVQLNTRYSIINFAFYTFLILVLVAIVYIYRLHSLKNKKELENEKTIESLSSVVSKNEEELLNQSLKKIQNTQSIELVKNEISKIANKTSISKLDIKKINKILDFNFNPDDEEWYDLQKHFNSVHSGFYDRLQKEFPTLTQTELRHCSLIKLHFSTKEIARYLHINPRSVQASRYRIKKKMKLDEIIDLKKFIIYY